MGGDRDFRMSDEERIERLKVFTNQMREEISDGSWKVMGIFDPEDSGAGLFLYTVGLTAHDRPELVVTGVPGGAKDFITHVINELGKRSLTEPLVPGEEYTLLVGGVDFRVRAHEVEPSDPRFVFGMAIRVFGHGRVRGILLDPLADSEPQPV